MKREACAAPARSPEHRSVRFIMRALERTMASPARDGSMVSSCAASLLGNCVAGELTTESVVGRYRDWPDDAIRALVLAHALYAPAAELPAMVAAARAELEWLAEFEVESAEQNARRAG